MGARLPLRLSLLLTLLAAASCSNSTDQSNFADQSSSDQARSEDFGGESRADDLDSGDLPGSDMMGDGNGVDAAGDSTLVPDGDPWADGSLVDSSDHLSGDTQGDTMPQDTSLPDGNGDGQQGGDALLDGQGEDLQPEDLTAQDLEPEVQLPPYVQFTNPTSGTAVVAGASVQFEATTNCFPAQVTFWADGQYKFGEFTTQQGTLSLAYAFNTPGVNRKIRVDVNGPDGCVASDQILLTVQAGFATGSEVLTDSNGNSFTVRWARFPTADTNHDFVVAGSSGAKTVENMAATVPDAYAAINGGYFAFGQGPVSYAKGRLGYESPSGNVKGPRGCLWYDHNSRTAGLTISMGRNFLGGSSWGDGLFPNATDVVCAGPTLLQNGVDVFEQQYDAENFGTSGISPYSPLPRTAICVLEDGGIYMLAAQSESVKARGFTLPELTEYLSDQGCKNALNLDGGGSTAYWSTGGYWYGTENRAVYNIGVVR